jgi:hypothetical protein
MYIWVNNTLKNNYCSTLKQPLGLDIIVHVCTFFFSLNAFSIEYNETILSEIWLVEVKGIQLKNV